MTTVVSTADYRSHLREWHERAGAGEDLIVTDNGRPVVRVVAASADDVLARWEAAGILRRGRPRRPSAEIPVVPVPGDSTATISADREPRF